MGIVGGGLAGGMVPSISLFAGRDFVSKRPLVKKFRSVAVEALLKEIASFLPDKELAWLFENCFPNTLDTTVDFSMKNGEPDTFVITGDINAMWLRDSSAQVWPYLSLANQDPDLKLLLKGVINRQAKCILIDPYANAFNKSKSGSGWKSDLTEMKPELHERKWEIDSLCYPVRLAYGYWKSTGDGTVLQGNWKKAALLILQTFSEQQRKSGNGPYHFQRRTETPTDTVPLSGYGNPTRKVGLIHSMFRPSDDACLYPFLVPANLFAVQSLKQLSEIADEIWLDQELKKRFLSLAKEVQDAIEQHAIVIHPDFGKVYAYEVDGFGNYLFMDDANVPSLLSLPYLGAVDHQNEVYQNTRKMVLSSSNPYFFEGTKAKGIGGPHVGLEMIWPLSLIIQGLTTSNELELNYCIASLKATHAGTGFMHESFHMNAPERYTRSWFAWANTLFGELIYRVYKENPTMLQKQF